jgi:hypothetical protein
MDIKMLGYDFCGKTPIICEVHKKGKLLIIFLHKTDKDSLYVFLHIKAFTRFIPRKSI